MDIYLTEVYYLCKRSAIEMDNLQFHGEHRGIGTRLWGTDVTLLVTYQLAVAALVALLARPPGYGLHADRALQATTVD